MRRVEYYSILSRNIKITLLQLDGKTSGDKLKEAIETGKKACEKICEEQKKALMKIKDEKIE